MNIAPKFLLAVFFMSFDVSSASATICYKEACRKCAKGAENNKGEPIKCEFKNAVLPMLDGGNRNVNDKIKISSEDYSDEYEEDEGETIDSNFVCIKMVAKDLSIDGGSMDVIKGCTFKTTAQSICSLYVNQEKGKNRKQTECFICEEDYCNGSFKMTSSIVLVAISAVLTKILNY